MAVARRNANYGVARLDQRQMGCHRRACQAIEHRDVVGFGKATQVIER
jgi:hypothetical protein